MSGKSTLKPITKAWWTAIMFVLLYSILRGIRFPNIWSYSHFLFNYDFGFAKRSLVGALIGFLGHPYLITYDFFFLFSIAIFLLNVVLLSLLIRDFISWGERLSIVASLIFASSLAIVFLSHTIGYFDHLGLLVTLVTLRMTRFRTKAIFLVVVLPLLFLTHEGMLVLFFPVIFMSLVFSMQSDFSVRKAVVLGLITLLSLICVYYAANGRLERREVKEMYQTTQSRIDHPPLRRDAYAVLRYTARGYLDYMTDLRGTDEYRERMRGSLLATAPSFLVFALFSFVILRAAKAKLGLIVLSLSAALAPLLLHYGGSDLSRWNTLAITTSFLVFYMVCSSTRGAVDLKRYDKRCLAFVILVLINGVSSTVLFDGRSVKNLPFHDHLEYIGDVLAGQDRFPHVPKR